MGNANPTQRRAIAGDADRAPLLMWVAGPDRRMTFLNRSARAFTGLDTGQRLESWAALVHPADRARYRSALTAALAARRTLRAQYRLRRRDGQYRWLLEHCAPIQEGAEAGSCSGWCVDVSDFHRTESQLRRRLAQQEAAGEALARERDRFLSVISHELRSPLNVIQSWAYVLEHQGATPAMQRALGGIRTGVQQQVQMIDGLLDATRVVSGQAQLAQRRFALEGVVIAALDSVRDAAAAQRVMLAADLRLDGAEIEGDPQRVRQILWNLLDNAIKFGGRGGHVVLRAGCDGAQARIDISDDGPGIPRAFLPHLFDPFRQASAGRTRSHDGLGLGLALARQLTEQHGGRIDAITGGEQRGTTFRISLPLAPSLPSLDGVRVLVVDDQAEAREATCSLLAGVGAEALAAESALAAIAALDDCAPHALPQVLVCDIAMPGEDGYRALERIRCWEHDHCIGAPIAAAALSAFVLEDDRQRSLDCGFRTHLTKPVAAADLVGVVARLAAEHDAVKLDAPGRGHTDSRPSPGAGDS
jgi:PAS domain S-box-containing protein